MTQQFEPDREHLQRVRRIFEAALELELPARERYLSETCAGDRELQEEVTRLLQGHEQPMDLLEKPAILRLKPDEWETGDTGLPVGSLIGERFEIAALLGRGGMGIVYKAWDRILRRPVALKMLPQQCSQDPVFQRNLKREAVALASLRHPNICSIYDVCRQEGRDCIVMEYLEGETLAHRIRAQGALKVADLVSVGIELCRALQYAHDHGVLHRDLKPANLMLTPEGLKLLDFGIASWRDPGEFRSLSSCSDIASEETATQNSEVNGAGTVQYMSPEQALGEPLDARSDVFSLGVVLYEMATGTLPFKGMTVAEVLDGIIHKESSPIALVNRETPRALQVIVSKCLAKSRELRFASALATERALQAITDKPGVEPAGQAPALGLQQGWTQNSWKQSSTWAAAAMIMALISVPVYQHFDLRSATSVRYTQAAALSMARQTATELGCSTDGLKPRVAIAPAFEMDEVLATEGIARARRVIQSGHSFAWQIDFSSDARLRQAFRPGCSVLLDVSGQLLEFLSHDQSRLAAAANPMLERRAAELAQAFLHLPPNSVPKPGGGGWIIPAAARGWHEEITVSLTEKGQVLGLSWLLLRDRSSHVAHVDERAAAMLDSTKGILAIGLYGYGWFILLTRWRFLVLPWRVPVALALSPALAAMWLIFAMRSQFEPSVHHGAVLFTTASIIGLITFTVTLPAMAGLFALLRHSDHVRTAGVENLLRAGVRDHSTLRQIADGVLAGTVVAGFYVLQSIAVQWGGHVPNTEAFEMGLVGGTAWMFGEIGLAWGAAAWTVAMITTYMEAGRLLHAPRLALPLSAVSLALLTVDVQTLHWLPGLFGVFAVACQLLIYQTSGLLAALVANGSSFLFFASLVGLHLNNPGFVNQSVAIAAIPILLLGAALITLRLKADGVGA